MRGKGLVLGALGASLLLAAPAAAQDPGASKNVEHLKTISEAKNATAINFLEYRQGGHGWGDKGGGRTLDVMAVTGRFGVKTYSLENPAKPKLLDEISAERLKLEGDPDVDFGPPDTSAPVSTFWQNEDMDVDQDRKLLLLSRDPRAYGGTTNLSPGDPNPAGATNIAGVYIVDARDPEALRLLAFQELPTGHTTTCINGCKWLWTGGPAATTKQQGAPQNWTFGRPIIVTDLTNPSRPRAYPMNPVDLFRRDGVTAYSHDVQVDDDGIAWVSGDGGTRGYYTDGRRWNRSSAATARPPRWSRSPSPAAESRARSPTTTRAGSSTTPSGRSAATRGDGRRKGELLLMAEEDFGPAAEGLPARPSRCTIASLKGSYNGEAWKSTPGGTRSACRWSASGRRSRRGLAAGCRPVPVAGELLLAHYFDVDGSLVTYAWYGARLPGHLERRDPRRSTSGGRRTASSGRPTTTRATFHRIARAVSTSSG